jgi:PleD family two-component response regulator
MEEGASKCNCSNGNPNSNSQQIDNIDDDNNNNNLNINDSVFKHLKILIVDDSAIIRKMVARILRGR